MPEPAEQPAPPIRTWRPMVAWTLGLLAALGLAWFVGAVAVPVWQVRTAMRDCPAMRDLRTCLKYECHGGPSARMVYRCDPQEAAPTIAQLGGEAAAARKLSLFVRRPAWANGRSSRKKIWPQSFTMLSCCGRPGLEALLALQNSRDRDTVIQASEGLCSMCPEFPEAPLAVGRAAAEGRVDGLVIWSLGHQRLHAAGAAPDMERLLRSADPHIRAAAAVALCRIDPSKRHVAMPVLIESMTRPREKDLDGDVREAAADALENTRAAPTKREQKP